MRRICLSTFFLLTGCALGFDPPANNDSSSSSGEGEGSDTNDEGSTSDSSSSTTTSDDGGECQTDDDCSGNTPLCEEGVCLACTQLGVGGCEMRDPLTPACDSSSGACQECTESQTDLCGGDTPVCVSGMCAPCTDSAQCESGTCLLDLGQCLAVEVDINGRIFDLSDPATSHPVDTVTATNVDPSPTDDSVGVDGDYDLPGIPPYSLVDIDVYDDQGGSGVNVFEPMRHTRASVLAQNESPLTVDVPLLTYAEVSRLAYECNPERFASLAAAQGTDTGNANTYFLTRSTILGQLLDQDGTPLTGTELSRFSVSIKLKNWTNTHANEADTDDEDASLCWLEMGDDELLHANPNATLSDSGMFAMFRVRNDTNLGDGLATVNVLGFDPATVNLASSGNMGYVELIRNDEDLTRDFERDVYPIFTKEGCVNCHTNGGPDDGLGGVLGVRDGFAADWDLDPDSVYDNLVGPGTECFDGGDPPVLIDENRICTDNPVESLVVQRPLAELEGADDVHPVDIFPSLENPTVQILIEWIEQGAERGEGIGPVSFTNDIYPLFNSQGCTGCHKDGGPDDGMGGVLGMRDGFAADWSLSPQEVYDLLVGPGTTCFTPVQDENRICTDSPEDSLMVTRPLVDEPGEDDPHPTIIFPTVDHPDLQLIINWIAQGAEFN